MNKADIPYDMNKPLSPEESRSQIWTLLMSAGLQKHMDLLMAARVDFHAFCNLTREDMRHIGIKNYKDQDILIELVRPMSAMYRELNNYKVNGSLLRKNLLQSSEMLTASLAQMRMALRKRPITRYQSLVDHDVPSTKAILLLLDLMQSRINLIDRDLKACKKLANDVQEPRSRLNRKVVITGATLVLVAVAMWRFKVREGHLSFRM